MRKESRKARNTAVVVDQLMQYRFQAAAQAQRTGDAHVVTPIARGAAVGAAAPWAARVGARHRPVDPRSRRRRRGSRGATVATSAWQAWHKPWATRFDTRRRRASFFAREFELEQPMARRGVNQPIPGSGQVLTVFFDGCVVALSHRHPDRLGRRVHTRRQASWELRHRSRASAAKNRARNSRSRQNARRSGLNALAALPRAPHPLAQIQRIAACQAAQIIRLIQARTALKTPRTISTPSTSSSPPAA